MLCGVLCSCGLVFNGPKILKFPRFSTSMAPLVFELILNEPSKVYFPGDVLKGKVRIELELATAVSEFGIEFSGREISG